VSSVHRMALTTLHGRRQQKSEPCTRFRSDDVFGRGGGRSIGGGSPFLNWMPLDWLQEDLSTPPTIGRRWGEYEVVGRTSRLEGSAARAWGDAAGSR
jgi:hypothetical protein